MASLRKRIWETKKGKSVRWELSFMKDGIQRKKTFKKKPTPEEMAQVTKTNSKNPILKFAFLDYIENNCALHCKDSTIETYMTYYKTALKPLYPLKVKSVTKRNIERFIIAYKEQNVPKTVNNLLVFIKAFFNYQIELKNISENPAKKIKPLPLEKKDTKAMNENERECFEKYAKGSPPWVYLFFMTMLYMGIRISECAALEWNDIDLKNKTMSINKQFYRQRITSTKNYETRVISMPDFLVELYKIQTIESNLVFNAPTQIGKHVNVNNIREHHFKNIVLKMEEGLEKDLSWLTPHCLRHTHATYLLSRSVPVKYVSERLGHKDCDITLNIYNHALPSDDKKAMEILNKIKQSENRAKNKLKA